ncbi:MAG: TetR/AcrR family transcriptional regulator [Acidimicrobiales bacterium]
MAPDPTPSEERRLTACGRERRASLLTFATHRFADNGYHPTSVADIVEGIGVGKGVFYWYFTSKDQLLLEIMAESLLDLRRTQQAAIRQLSDPLVRLEVGIRTSIRWAADHADIMKLVMFCWTEEPFSTAVQRGRDQHCRHGPPCRRSNRSGPDPNR